MASQNHGVELNMKNNNQNNMLIGSLCALSCEVLFGLSYIFTKQAVTNASMWALLGWRFVIAFAVIIMLRACGIIKIDLKGKGKRYLILVALFSPILYFLGETVGISKTTASESGVFLACIPVSALIASTLILHKKPSKNQVIGILITLIGVMITVLAVGIESSLSITGYMFLLIAVTSYAFYSVFVEKSVDFTGSEITYAMILSGALVYGTAAIIEALMCGELGALIALPTKNGAFLSAVLFQGIGCSIGAFFLSNVAIAKIGVNKTSSFIGLSTVVSIISGVILLSEPFTKYQIIGAAVIVAGVYIANFNFSKKL